MKKITVPKITKFNDLAFLELNAKFEGVLEKHNIDCQAWQEFASDGVRSSFSIAHIGSHLLLKYYSVEEEINAFPRATNGEVNKDNCVELFIAFGDENYYNLEFNCLGSAKVGYGDNRKGRKMLSPEMISGIKRYATINSQIDDGCTFSWEIFLMIPREIFMFNNLRSFDGLKCRANFYKCGDGLQKSHFLSWNRVCTAGPDFHQSQYFGQLNFL
jgi:hypothetical protein